MANFKRKTTVFLQYGHILTQYMSSIPTVFFMVTSYSINGSESFIWIHQLPNNHKSTSLNSDYFNQSFNPSNQMEKLSSGGGDLIFIVSLCSRILSLLVGYHQLTMLHRLGSRQTLGLTCLFAAISSLLFSSTAHLFYNQESELRDPISYFILICDLPKAAILASIATSIPHSVVEIRGNIIKGLRQLGPLLFVDTVFALLVICLGFLTGIPKLRELCSIACLSVTINSIVFLTVYPAIILPFLKLSKYTKPEDKSIWDNFSQETDSILLQPIRTSEEIQQFVKLDSSRQQTKLFGIVILGLGYILWWFSISLDQIIVLVLTVTLAIRYLFFEDKLEKNSLNLQELYTSSTTTSTETISTSGSCAARKSGNIFKPDFFTQTITPIQRVVPVSVGPLVQSSILSEDDMPFGKFLSAKPSSLDVKTKNKKDEDLPTILTPDQGYASTAASSNSGSVSPIAFSIGDQSDSESDPDELIKPTTGTDSVGIQTLESALREFTLSELRKRDEPQRPIEECLSIYKSEDGAKALTDDEVIALVDAKHIPAYQLEKAVDDPERGVAIRRQLLGRLGDKLTLSEQLPYQHYDYSLVMGACCENVVGYIPIPVGVAGPFKVDDALFHIPMATTEGCLIASTNRGCRALVNGVRTRVFAEGMSRAPVVRFPSSVQASDAKLWLDKKENFQKIKESFDSSSRFARLEAVQCRIAGRLLYIRFVAKTGDAMGMNMISKGTEIALHTLHENHPEMEVMSLSGNVCTDKKPAAINWLEGRGKSVVAEAIVPAHIVENVLKTTVEALVELNMAKNLVGSAMAGSIGGFNAHAANIVTAIYIATGQDPAQNIGSSNCMTLMEPWGVDGRDLYISCTMPSIEVGTVGGGTFLPAQAACLQMLGVKGANLDNPGENSRTLARLVCASVLAGELSLMSALAAGHLVRSHLKHNRSTASFNSPSAPVTPTTAIKFTKSNTLSPANIVTAPQPPCSLSSKIEQNNKSNPLRRKSSTKSEKISSRKASVSSRSSSLEFLSVPDCKQS